MVPVRVLIVADDPLARAGLAALLQDLPGLLVVGRIAPADGITAAIETHAPEVLLWDMGWQAERSAEQVSTVRPATPVAVLVNDEADARLAWASGVQAVLARDSGAAQIEAALVALAHKLLVIDPQFRDASAQATPALPTPPGGEEPPLVEELTARELQVLRLLAEGLPNKTIAQRLDISEHTVKFHVNALLGKLSVASRTEAVVRATRLGLIFL